jgi:hypothetical protein
MSNTIPRRLALQGAFSLGAAGLASSSVAVAQTPAALSKGAALQLTRKWDKTFTQSKRVAHRKVTFTNRYGITLAGDLYQPKGASGKQAALVVCGPFGAVKEQSSGLYAQTMAERGFVTLAFDGSFTGESGGEPRNVASPDINSEDFMAAVDFIGLQHPSEGRRTAFHGRLLRLLRDATRLPPTGGQLRQCLDDHHTAVVHEHADPDLHQGDFAVSSPDRPW